MDLIPTKASDQEIGGAASPAGGQQPLTPRIISSGDLLKGKRELIIHHNREVYRLKLTGSNKLILTK